MASSCIKRGLDWTTGKKFLYRKSSEALEQAAQGSGGAAIPGDVQKTCRHGTSGHGLAGMVVLG